MKTMSILFVTLIFLSSAQASSEVVVKIDSLSNLSSGGALEACGTAVHSKGTKPLMVTVKHDQSYYTTLTAPNNVWCVVIKRWTNSGQIEVGATTFSDPSGMKLQTFSLPQQ